MHKAVVFLLTALIVTPLSQAHGAPNPIEAEDLVLDDEATDNTAGQDGWDIQTVHVREAYFTGEEGVAFRWTVWGGDVSGSGAPQSLELVFDQPSNTTLTWTTTDNGYTWTASHGYVLEVEAVQDSEGFDPAEAPLPTMNVQFQAFVSYADLGVGRGGSIENMFATAYTGTDRVDIAPGGYFYAAQPDEELQDPGATSERVLDSVPLDGPDRYTLSEVSLAGSIVQVTTDNLIAVSGQHISISSTVEPIKVEAGRAAINFALREQSTYNLTAGEDVIFRVHLPDFNVTQIHIDTDLGGRETFWVRSDGTVSTDALEPLPPEQVEEPFVAVAPVLVALAVLVAAVRRRD